MDKTVIDLTYDSGDVKTTKSMKDLFPDIEYSAMHRNAFTLDTRKRRSVNSMEGPDIHPIILKPPNCVSESSQPARKGYERSMQQHEFLDDAETLQIKVKQLAEMIKSSKRCVAYTGAGLSTGTSIQDYASKNNDSSVTKNTVNRKASCKLVMPGLSHRVLTALHEEGHLKELI